MPQKNAFIIDDDRDFALKMAAALRTDGLKVGLSEGDRDPLDEIKLERPDIVIVRAEGKNNESGFSICNRLKKSKRWARTSVFLYSADENGTKLDKHKAQSTPADDYIMLPEAPPYPFDEIRARVKSMLFPVGGVSKPPPLPPAREDIKPVTPEDNAFIEKVMDSLVSTSDEEVPSRPPVKREPTQLGRRTTADHKLDMLRQKLRQRESELAKVMEMYRAKEREYHEWNEKLVERDVEAQSLRMTIEDLSASQKTTREELDRRTTEFNASFERLLEEKVNRENELIQIVAGKEKDLADVQASLSLAQQESEQQSKELGTKIEVLDGELATASAKLDELETTLGDREQAIEDLEKDLADARNQIASFEATVASQVDALADREAAHLDLQAKILELRTDLAATRDDIDELVRSQSFEVAARDDLIEGLRADLTTTEANAAQLESDLSDELEETKANLSAEQTAHLEASAKAESLQAALQTLEVETTDKATGLMSDIARLSDAEASLQAELAAAQTQIEDVESARGEEKVQAEARQTELEAQVADRDGRIDALTVKLSDEEGAHQQTQEARAQQVAQLEGELASAEQAAADQAERLQETIAARDASLEERSAEIGRLQGDLEDVRGQLSQANDLTASLHVQLEEEKDRYEALDRENKDRQAAHEVETAEINALLSRTKEEAEGLESDLRGQIIAIGADLATRGDRVDALERDLDSERRERANAERHGAELEQALSDTKEQLGSTTDSLRQTERELGSLRETLALTEGRLSEVQENLRTEQATREAADQSLSELRATLDQRGAEIGRLEGRVAVLDENGASLKVEYAELEDEYDRVKDELSARTSDLAAARSEASERAERLSEVRTQLEQREAKLDEVSGRLSEVTHDKDQLLAAKEGLTAEQVRLTAELTGLGGQKDALAAQIAQLEDHVDELRTELDTRQGRIVALDESLTEWRDKNAALDQSKIALSADLARAQEAQARLQDELSHAREEWERNRTELVAERDGVRSRLQELGTELDKVRAARDSLERENDKLEEQGQQQKHNDAAALAQLQAQLAQTEAELNERVQSLQGDVERGDLERAGLNAELASTKEALDSERASHEQVRDDLEASERVLAKATADHVEATEAALRLQSELEARLHEVSGAKTSALAEADGIRQDLEAQLAKSVAEAERAQAAFEAERSKHAEARQALGDEVSGLSERLEEATTRAAALASEKSTDGQRHDEQVGQLQARIDELSAAVQSRDRAMVDARAEQGELQARLEAARRERDEVENRYIKELEEVHDDYNSKAREADGAHSKEVDKLRAQTLEAKRQLKTSQLAAQRLTDRIQKLETERPQRTSAEADFDSFIASFKDSELPIPSTVPSPKAPPRRRPVPAAPRTATPAPAADKTEAAIAAPADLSRGAAVPQADKEDDVTLVGKMPDGGARVSPPRRNTRRPKPGPDDGGSADLASDLVSEPPKGDDFLEAFDREFKNLKP